MGHGGDAVGASSFFLLFPAQRIAVAIVCNLSKVPASAPRVVSPVRLVLIAIRLGRSSANRYYHGPGMGSVLREANSLFVRIAFIGQCCGHEPRIPDRLGATIRFAFSLAVLQSVESFILISVCKMFQISASSL